MDETTGNRPNEPEGARAALQASEEKFRNVFQNAPVGFILTDGQGVVLDCNLHFSQLFGARQQDYLGMDLLARIPDGAVRQNLVDALSDGEIHQYEGPYSSVVTGKKLYLKISSERVAPDLVITIIEDVTERKRAEEERKAHIRFLESLEQVDRAIKQETDVGEMLWAIVKTVSSLFDCDRAWLLYPCDPDAPSFRVPVEVTKPQYPGAQFLDVDVPMSPEQAATLREALDSADPVVYVAGTNRPIAIDERFGVQSQMFSSLFPKLGKPWVFGMHQCSYPRLWTPEERDLFKEIGRRVSDGLSSVLFLRELQENEERFRATFEQAAVGIAHVAPNGRWMRVNQKLCDIVGYCREELLQKTFQDLAPPGDRGVELEYLHQVLVGEIPTFSLEKQCVCKDGSTVWINLTVSVVRSAAGEPVYFIVVMEDVNERKRAERDNERLQGQLLQAQKMESVGRLAGGVAHDFNNMLSVILGHAELALARMDPATPLHDHLLNIQKAAERSADLTRQLLAFARKQTVAPRVLDVNETVEGMLKMLQRLIGEQVVLTWKPGENLWPVNVDPSQIDQILANLCVNARDAIADIGTITIETGNVSSEEGIGAHVAGFVPGEYVRLTVSDNGCGMDAETLSHIFEPFFTTKRVGEGTGLGLSTVYGAVKQNGGFVDALSVPGKGTTLAVYLPRHVGRAEGARLNGAEKSVLPGQETILLVEDEPAILRVAASMLQDQGYRVLAASTPGEALQLAREHAGQIDLLLTDVVMPEMNGRDLAKNLLSLYPHMKRLFMSGYTADVIAHHGVLDAGVHFIQKPFRLRELAVKMREVLGGGR